MAANIKYLHNQFAQCPTIDELEVGEYFVLAGGSQADKLLLRTEYGPVFAGSGGSLHYAGNEPVRRVNVSIEVTAA
jgi:hypothetical protein